jgi:hypothetical protein
MNRRKFFGMTIAAVAAAGLPALVLPERTIFLPPRAGWFPEALRMREVQQYLINTDTLATRWDVLVSAGDGDHYQVTQTIDHWIEDPIERSEFREFVRRGMASHLTMHARKEPRFANAKPITHALKLFGGAYV